MMNYSGNIMPSVLEKTFSRTLLSLPSSPGVGTCTDNQAEVGTSEIKGDISEIKGDIEYFSIFLCGFAQQIAKIS